MLAIAPTYHPPSYAPIYTPVPTSKVAKEGLPIFNQTIGNVKDLVGPFNYALESFYIIIGIIAVAYLIYSGIRYISANGNKDTITQARQGIVYAIFGIIIIMTSFAIIAVIANLARTLR